MLVTSIFSFAYNVFKRLFPQWHQKSLLPVLNTLFFPSHWLLFYITVVKAMVSNERVMNPLTMTIIKPQKESAVAERGIKTTAPFSQVLYATDVNILNFCSKRGITTVKLFICFDRLSPFVSYIFAYIFHKSVETMKMLQTARPKPSFQPFTT